MEDNLLEDSAGRLFARYSPQLQNSEQMWADVEEAGFLPALLREEEGGYGLGAWAATAPLRHAALRGLQLPLAETMAAHWLLAQIGQTPVSGVISLVFSGQAQVPWGKAASQVLFVSDKAVHLYAGTDLDWQPGQALCGHPLDQPLNLPAASAPLPLHLQQHEAEAVLALLRSIQIAAALQGILEMCRTYASERMQFGRRLAAFQVIQQYLAVVTTHAAAARAAAEMAAAGFDRRTQDPAAFVALAAAAKIRCGEAAAVVAGLAHQIHGAIGFSQEYPLHYLTRSLWTWRDMNGTETEWAGVLTRLLGATGGSGLWYRLTRLQAGEF